MNRANTAEHEIGRCSIEWLAREHSPLDCFEGAVDRLRNLYLAHQTSRNREAIFHLSLTISRPGGEPIRIDLDEMMIMTEDEFRSEYFGEIFEERGSLPPGWSRNSRDAPGRL